MPDSKLIAPLRVAMKKGDPRDALECAVALHRADQTKEAERAYLSILHKWPDHPDAVNGIAMLHAASDRHEEALQLLTRICERFPQNPGYFINRGSVEVAAGHLDAAIASFETAIRLRPHYQDPYHSLCDALLRLGRADEAVEVCDRAIAAAGRDFHALAFKAHALRDAGRQAESDALLDHDKYTHTYRFDPPHGFADINAFNAACAKFISSHHTLQANVMSTEHGKHTGELLAPFGGSMEALRATINQSVRWYLKQIPDDPSHPMTQWKPREWKITSWGVLMFNKGHEWPHIHPKGWMSGVFYLQLPELIHDSARKPEGWLEFGRPTPALHVKSAPTVRHYQPGYGAMYLFPSYFYNGTVPFKSEQRRICVAFDIEPVA